MNGDEDILDFLIYKEESRKEKAYLALIRGGYVNIAKEYCFDQSLKFVGKNSDNLMSDLLKESAKYYDLISRIVRRVDVNNVIDKLPHYFKLVQQVSQELFKRKKNRRENELISTNNNNRQLTSETLKKELLYNFLVGLDDPGEDLL